MWYEKHYAKGMAQLAIAWWQANYVGCYATARHAIVYTHCKGFSPVGEESHYDVIQGIGGRLVSSMPESIPQLIVHSKHCSWSKQQMPIPDDWFPVSDKVT